MGKKENSGCMSKYYLALVAIVAIVAIVSLFKLAGGSSGGSSSGLFSANKDLTGNAVYVAQDVYSIKPKTDIKLYEKDTKSCTGLTSIDVDSVLNKSEVKVVRLVETIKLGKKQKKEVAVSLASKCYNSKEPNTLLHYYCDQNLAHIVRLDCKNGCKDGACIAPPVPVAVQQPISCEEDNECPSGSVCDTASTWTCVPSTSAPSAPSPKEETKEVQKVPIETAETAQQKEQKISITPQCDIIYDYNGDGYVGKKDSDFLSQLLLKTVTCPTGKTCDINGDKKVSSVDLQLFVTKNQACIDASAANPALEKSVCGNNFIETGELCDGIQLISKTCPAGKTGSIVCKSDCSDVDTSGCKSLAETCKETAKTIESGILMNGAYTPTTYQKGKSYCGSALVLVIAELSYKAASVTPLKCENGIIVNQTTICPNGCDTESGKCKLDCNTLSLNDTTWVNYTNPYSDSPPYYATPTYRCNSEWSSIKGNYWTLVNTSCNYLNNSAGVETKECFTKCDKINGMCQ
ncbi:hypothetical protein HZA96_04875 [Candidatus Woesearchaeota archaeon]|nr:hypothetical protein [Candidatus Woesearchaeota archaeon]